MKNTKRIISLLFVLLLTLTLFSCKNNQEVDDNDIVILFTNDVHCGIDSNIGYAGLVSYKKYVESYTDYVTLVDVGDHVQGEYLGTVSKGENIIKIMNKVGYDLCTFGNHEFDYGLEQLSKNINDLNAEYISFNFSYIGSNETLKNIAPYKLISYGDKTVAYIGISTPYTIESSSPLLFAENDVRVCDFGKSLGTNGFCNKLQNVIDECKNKGADYVVCLAHLGVSEDEADFSSTEIIKGTTGIDVLLDGHSHVEETCNVVKNKDGKGVYVCQTGTKLTNIGQLIITSSGVISVGYISNYEDKDEETVSFIENIKSSYLEEMQRKIFDIDFDLKITDADGIRMIRNREMPIGNLVADAYRYASGADIAFCNGGGIRSDIKAGDVTYENIIAVNPYGNSLCVIEVTGSELADMLESFYYYTESEYKKDGKAYCENGSFQQVSGLKFTINTNIASSAIFDEDDMFTGVGDTRRVSDIYILQNGVYEPLDINKTYTLASHSYMIKNGGSSMGVFLKGKKLLIDEGIADYQMLIDYIVSLNGDFSKYLETENRITIK